MTKQTPDLFLPWKAVHSGTGDCRVEGKPFKTNSGMYTPVIVERTDWGTGRMIAAGPYWKRLAEANEKLLVCYRVGKNPGGIIDEVRAAKDAIAKAEGRG